jgi:hypothetical protein
LIGAPAGSRLTLGASNAGNIVLNPDVPGQYKLSLTTTDSVGSTTTSTLAVGSAASGTGVVCGNASPTIAAGSLSGAQAATSLTAPAQFVALGSPVKLNATTNDADSTATATCTVAEAQPLTYQWSFTLVPAGSTATLLAANTLNASFTPDVVGLYKLSLTVTDPQNHATTDTSLIVDAECGSVAPSVAIVTGSVRDFTATQDLTVNGNVALHTVHASRSANNSATLTPGGASTLKPFYPGVPVQLAANVPNPVAQGAGCPAVTDPELHAGRAGRL